MRSPKERRPRAPAGFTLLEVMIALAILAVGLLAIARMQMTAIQGNADARDVTRATKWARDKIEDLMIRGYDDTMLTDMDGDGGAGLDDIGEGADRSEARGGYTVFWNVSEDDPVANAKTVRVVVAWQGRDRSRLVRLTCIKPEL